VRYKAVARILLILSVINFVLAAPVIAREVRRCQEATADAVDRGEDVKIVEHKREKIRIYNIGPSSPESDRC
jgi:hypothetical protein